MRSKLLYLAVLPLCLILAACPNTPYGKAVKLGLDVTDTIHTGADTVDKLRLNGTLTVAEERAALTYLNTLNDLDVNVYGDCVKAAHAASGTAQAYSACATSLANSVSDPKLLAELHITNPQSQQKVASIGQAVSNLIQTAINGFAVAAQKGQ